MGALLGAEDQVKDDVPAGFVAWVLSPFQGFMSNRGLPRAFALGCILTPRRGVSIVTLWNVAWCDDRHITCVISEHGTLLALH